MYTHCDPQTNKVHNPLIYCYVQFNEIVLFTMQRAAARARRSDRTHSLGNCTVA